MGFLVYCDNKGCGKDQEPLLLVETDEVICRACGKSIKSITKFAKAQMRSLGQIQRNTNQQETFSIKCPGCRQQGQPKINDKNQIICKSCQQELTEIPKPFQHLIRTHLANILI